MDDEEKFPTVMSGVTRSTFYGKPPKYSPSTPLRVHFSQLEDFFEWSGISNDQEKIASFRMGLPAAEYKRFCLDTTLPDDYMALKDKLLNIYDPPPSEQKLVEEFHNRRQRPGENVTIFGEAVKDLALRAYLFFVAPHYQGSTAKRTPLATAEGSRRPFRKGPRRPTGRTAAS